MGETFLKKMTLSPAVIVGLMSTSNYILRIYNPRCIASDNVTIIACPMFAGSPPADKDAAASFSAGFAGGGLGADVNTAGCEGIDLSAFGTNCECFGALQDADDDTLTISMGPDGCAT